MELSFGEKIRLLREEWELNQTDLGREINMTQRKVSYLENDKYEPSVEDIVALCRFFHVSADYLLGFPNPLPYPNRCCTDIPGTEEIIRPPVFRGYKEEE